MKIEGLIEESPHREGLMSEVSRFSVPAEDAIMMKQPRNYRLINETVDSIRESQIYGGRKTETIDFTID